MREFTGNNAGRYYFAMELPGHVTGLLNASGARVNHYGYSAYGKMEHVYETVANPLRYMAREWDPDAGLYYVRNRWYDPETGRFVSEDPIGLAGGINVYAYAANDPVNGRDPYGLLPCTWYEVRAWFPGDVVIVKVLSDGCKVGPAPNPSNRGGDAPRGDGSGSGPGAGPPPRSVPEVRQESCMAPATPLVVDVGANAALGRRLAWLPFSLRIAIFKDYVQSGGRMDYKRGHPEFEDFGELQLRRIWHRSQHSGSCTQTCRWMGATPRREF